MARVEAFHVNNHKINVVSFIGAFSASSHRTLGKQERLQEGIAHSVFRPPPVCELY